MFLLKKIYGCWGHVTFEEPMHLDIILLHTKFHIDCAVCAVKTKLSIYHIDWPLKTLRIPVGATFKNQLTLVLFFIDAACFKITSSMSWRTCCAVLNFNVSGLGLFYDGSTHVLT